MFFVYIAKCADETLYVGFTNDLKKRLHAHNFLKSGAKYTRGRRPISFVYHERFRSITNAKKREWVLKQLSRTEKLSLTEKFTSKK